MADRKRGWIDADHADVTPEGVATRVYHLEQGEVILSVRSPVVEFRGPGRLELQYDRDGDLQSETFIPGLPKEGV